MILLVLYFLQFYLTSLRGKEAAWKKIKGARAGATWEKNKEPEPLKKKLGAGAAKKWAVSPALKKSVTYRVSASPQTRCQPLNQFPSPSDHRSSANMSSP